MRPGTDGMDGCDRHRKSVIPSPRPVRRVYSLIVSYVVIAKIFLAKCAKDSYEASYKKLSLLYLGQTPAAADVRSLTTKPESQNKISLNAFRLSFDLAPTNEAQKDVES